MSRYVLQPDWRLLGWKGDPFFLARRSDGTTRRLSLTEFAFLLRCDGQTEMGTEDWPPVPDWAVRQRVIAPCAGEERLRPEQEYRLFPNRRAERMHLSVTGRCNLNCRHCFHAADCRPRSEEPTLEQLSSLLDSMEACGVRRLRLDGGEPLMRRDLLNVTAEMAKRDIAVCEIMTNGALLTPGFLDELEKQGHRPRWFVSFDGLGCHDWLRGVPGTEEKALEAIGLLCRRGYCVNVHQCVWRDSLPSVRPTVRKMQELGVSRYRIVPVEPSLRWRETSAEQSISIEQWLRYIPGFLDWWYGADIHMDLDLWSFWTHRYGDKRACIVPDLASGGGDDDSPACASHRNRPFIDADGRVVPCMPLSGITGAYGIGWGNVYQGDDLRELFTDSPFLDQISCTCGQIKESNPKCHSCPWRDRCAAACRAEALARCGRLNGIDERICMFFESGCYEQLQAVAEKWGLETGAHTH